MTVRKPPEIPIGRELSEDNRTYRNNLLPVGSRDISVSTVNTPQAGR